MKELRVGARRRQPVEKDWRVRRAEYLLECKRFDELDREELAGKLEPRRIRKDAGRESGD